MKKRIETSQGLTRLAALTGKLLVPVAMFGALGVFASSCGPDTTASQAQSCIADDDCALGTVCILTTKQCEAVSCDFCLTGQICYEADDGAQSCSKPECTSSSDCNGSESCVKGACIEATCSDKSDCPEGQVCNMLANICQQPPATCASNFDCPTGLVCKDDGSCAAGCSTDLDCEDADKFCNTDSNLCEPGCRTDASCLADQSCNADPRQCECTQGKCPAGYFCDDSVNACIEKQITSCDDVTCGENQYCDPDNNFQCVERPAECSTIQGDPNACPPGERCNQATGNCEVASCPNITQADCDGTDAPVLNTDFCACVQCVDDTHCPTGSSCNLNGQCVEGCEACDPNTPGACGDAAPLCFNGCCVECTTSAECTGSQVCLSSGRCGDPPSCAADPTVCPSGTECVNNTCQSTGGGGGQACNPGDPTSCLPPAMCLETSTGSGSYSCQGGGGGTDPLGGCSTSGCMNGLTCEPDPLVGTFMVCTGCTSDADCSAGESCTSLLLSESFCSPF